MATTAVMIHLTASIIEQAENSLPHLVAEVRATGSDWEDSALPPVEATAGTNLPARSTALTEDSMTAPGQGLPSDPFGQFQYPTVPLAVFQDDLIRNYRTFVERRRALRPSDEYREPTDIEWAEFQQHFHLRKLELGDCARPYGTPCRHEHVPLTEIV